MDNVNNETQIKQLIENWAKAVRDNHIDGILAHHADDIIMFDVPGPFQSKGIEAYRDTWKVFFKYTKPGVFDIKELKIVADEQVAFCIMTMKCEDKSITTDYVPLDFRVTIGLRKINNQWTIIHEHHSVPSE